MPKICSTKETREWFSASASHLWILLNNDIAVIVATTPGTKSGIPTWRKPPVASARQLFVPPPSTPLRSSLASALFITVHGTSVTTSLAWTQPEALRKCVLFGDALHFRMDEDDLQKNSAQQTTWLSPSKRAGGRTELRGHTLDPCIYVHLLVA